MEQAADAGRASSESGEARDAATAIANMNAAAERFAALELELRGPDGCPVEAEILGINDTEYLSSLADEAEEEHDAWYALLSEEERTVFDDAVEHDAAIIEEWRKDAGDEDEEETRFQRFQLVVA